MYVYVYMYMYVAMEVLTRFREAVEPSMNGASGSQTLDTIGELGVDIETESLEDRHLETGKE